MFRSLSVFVVLLLSSSSADTFEGNIKVLTRSLEKCGRSHDLGTCLRLKAVTMLDQALFSPAPVVINDFLSLAPDSKALENDTATSEKDLENALTEDPGNKDGQLDDMIADRMARFLSSRSLQFTLPSELDAETGRKKDKKKGGMMMMAALAMGGMMMQMMMGKIAMLAGKALLVGKMALLLSAIIGLKKLMGGGGGGDSHPQVVYATESHSSGGGHGGGGGGGGWGRSYIVESDNESADQLAYRGSRIVSKPIATSRSA